MYICGGWTELDVSGRPVPPYAFMVCRWRVADSLVSANESRKARGVDDGVEPK